MLITKSTELIFCKFSSNITYFTQWGMTYIYVVLEIESEHYLVDTKEIC
jgi:hypothetical protein